jgi:hypothetical protein
LCRAAWFYGPEELNPVKEGIHNGSKKESRKEKEETLRSSGAKSPYIQGK